MNHWRNRAARPPPDGRLGQRRQQRWRSGGLLGPPRRPRDRGLHQQEHGPRQRGGVCAAHGDAAGGRAQPDRVRIGIQTGPAGVTRGRQDPSHCQGGSRRSRRVEARARCRRQRLATESITTRRGACTVLPLLHSVSQPLSCWWWGPAVVGCGRWSPVVTGAVTSDRKSPAAGAAQHSDQSPRTIRPPARKMAPAKRVLITGAAGEAQGTAGRLGTQIKSPYYRRALLLKCPGCSRLRQGQPKQRAPGRRGQGTARPQTSREIAPK